VLPKFLETLLLILEDLPYNFEVIFVNDGSSDKTLFFLKEFAESHNEISYISLSRNFGHQAAITCGLQNSKGEAVIIMDADLQDPPTLIRDFLLNWEDGFQIVYAKRNIRKGESFVKKFFAKIYYRTQNWFSEINVPLDTGDFRLIDRAVVKSFLSMPERDRYARGMFAWLGFSSTYVLFDREPRFAGESKYSLRKMVELGISGVLGFSVRPLRIVTWMGFSVSFISLFFGFAAFLSRLFLNGFAVPGYTSIIVVVAFLGGLQLLGIGILGGVVLKAL
jgi:dolichol-phosphate mannosyltransferase